ncbi:unnamed protein product [Urochloa humidicola]
MALREATSSPCDNGRKHGEDGATKDEEGPSSLPPLHQRPAPGQEKDEDGHRSLPALAPPVPSSPPHLPPSRASGYGDAEGH